MWLEIVAELHLCSSRNKTNPRVVLRVKSRKPLTSHMWCNQAGKIKEYKRCMTCLRLLTLAYPGTNIDSIQYQEILKQILHIHVTPKKDCFVEKLSL